MPVSELLLEGLRLMLIGMGIVFSFLLMLVAVLRVMSAFANRFGAQPQAPRAFGASDDEGQPGQGELLAVIAAAITRYRNDRRRP
jgi:oxaloacetate decarboxylase gamma subunit